MLDLQLFPALDPVTLSGLRDSIREHGVVEPIVVDQHGRILDGHHRKALADELGVECPRVVVVVDDDDHARALAVTLNTDRRHLTVDQRRQYVAMRRQQGASLRQIADELGVTAPTVLGDLKSAGVNDLTPDTVRGADGKHYPARRPARDIQPGDVVHSDSHEPPRFVTDVEQRDDTVVLHDDQGDALIVGADHILDVEDEEDEDDKVLRGLCITCGEDFGHPVWHCPCCGGHQGWTRWQCHNCHQGERPAMSVAIEAHAEQMEREFAEKYAPKTKLGAPTKPDLGGGISHPARYTSSLLPVFARHLDRYRRVLDPFAGTGRIHELRDLGDFDTVGVELEPEWAALNPHTIVGNALDLPFDDHSFDAICTSPTYGNRLADHHNASDPESRRSYTHDLGRQLSNDNSGAMHWGPQYRDFHRQAWAEAVRVLRPGGRFLLNIKNHVRAGQLQAVCGWHVTELCRFDLSLLWHDPVETPHLAIGSTADLRAPSEWVFVFERDA